MRIYLILYGLAYCAAFCPSSNLQLGRCREQQGYLTNGVSARPRRIGKLQLNAEPGPVEEAERIERLAAEVSVVKEDAVWFCLVALLQTLPLVSLEREVALLYFGAMAVLTVYLGCKRIIIPGERQEIGSQQASLAPVLSSVSLFGLYLILKNTSLDPGTVYRFVATGIGMVCAAGVGGGVIAAALPEKMRFSSYSIPGSLQGVYGLTRDGLPNLIAGALGLAAGLIYLAPGMDLHYTFVLSNLMAFFIALQTIGVISLESFTTAVVFLTGLFLYDIWWVNFSEVMVTVATTIEAPVKLIYPLPPGIERAYDFSILGLGDLVIPAVFCSMMKNMDQAFDRDGEKRPDKLRYFEASIAGYAAGLAVCFYANWVTGAGQPALLFLCPSLVASAILVGLNNGEVQRVLSFSQRAPN
ncbi:unnamed protein product [Chrysoparadoxa australica]